MTTHRIFAAFLLTTAAACSSAQPEGESATAADTAVAESFTWPVPEHWAPETIPFPLDFAPTIPHQGVLELRFMPKFFTPGTPSYFSYDYVWQVEQTTFTVDSLKSDMTTYYAGLSQSADPDHFDASVHNASFKDNGDGSFSGVIHTTDGFNASAPITLNALVSTTTCGANTVAIFTISPVASDDPVWLALIRERGNFACSAK